MKYLLIILFALQSCDDANNSSNNGTDPDMGTQSDQSTDLKQDVKTSTDFGTSDTTADLRSEDTSADVSNEPDAIADVEIDTGTQNNFIFDESFNLRRDYKAAAGDWTLYNPERSTSVVSDNGVLTIVPVVRAQNAWFEDNQSSFLHRPVTGDFLLEASVKVSNIAGDSAPAVGYNSAGFVVRDPSSSQGNENWLMYNVGAQTAGTPFGVEVKTTVNSSSNLQIFAVDEGTLTFEMRICRLGNTFRYFYRPENNRSWTETLPTNPHVRDDFPATVDVGLMSGSWSEPVKGTFDWIRAWTPADCQEEAPN